MPKKVKKFIDKKESVTFRLVHRSQQDPLIVDERAPGHVLLEQKAKHDRNKDDGRQTSQSVDKEAVSKIKEEQRKFGVFFDDDYNYLQHLKDSREVQFEPISGFDVTARPLRQPQPKEKPNLILPSSVFASNVEEEVGFLNRAIPVVGPQPHLDPDVVAALDGDFDFNDSDNEIEDDFLALAGGLASAQSPLSSDMEESDEGDEGSDRSFDNEETKSIFTNYSMSSSVMHRTPGLILLDDQFEVAMGNYVDDKIGALDCDNIDGYILSGHALLENAIEEYNKDKVKIELGDLRKLGCDRGDVCAMSSDDDDNLVNMVEEEPVNKDDCESILTSYSTLYNHPKLIVIPRKPRPIKVSSKTGVPLDVLSGQGLTAAALKSLDSDVGPSSGKSVISMCSLMRAKNETTEEKRIRKQTVKEYRKERRIEKKANSVAFKEEKKKQAVMLSNVKEQLKGIKF